MFSESARSDVSATSNGNYVVIYYNQMYSSYMNIAIYDLSDPLYCDEIINDPIINILPTI